MGKRNVERLIHRDALLKRQCQHKGHHHICVYIHTHMHIVKTDNHLRVHLHIKRICENSTHGDSKSIT